MNDQKKKYSSIVDVPKEIDDYWHERWAEYMNEHYKEKFFEAGLAGNTFTEIAPDAPNGAGRYHFGFQSDGAFEFRDEEGDAVVEWDTYALAYRALGDETYNPENDIAEGRCRYTKNPEQFGKASGIISFFREALRVTIKETEEKFGVEMPKYW